MATVAFHMDASRVMMGQAGPELVKGDRLQASEKVGLRRMGLRRLLRGGGDGIRVMQSCLWLCGG